MIKNLSLLKIGYFYNMVDNFLHKIDLDALKKETGLTVDEIGALVEMKNPKGVYNWSKDQAIHGTRPSYNAIVKLLKAGATTETLFGVDYAATHQPASVLPPEFVKVNPEFVEGREQLMENFMKKGLVPEEKVKEIVRQEIERLLPSAKPINKF